VRVYFLVRDKKENYCMYRAEIKENDRNMHTTTINEQYE